MISTMPVISIRQVLSFFLGCVILKALELAPVAWALHLDDCGMHANRDSRNLNPDSFSNRVAIHTAAIAALRLVEHLLVEYPLVRFAIFIFHRVRLGREHHNPLPAFLVDVIHTLDWTGNLQI